MKPRFPIAATILTFACIAILCSLGAWQLHRLAWKTELLHKLDAEYSKDAANIILTPSDLSQTFDFKRGSVRGTYDYDKQIKVGPRVYEDLPGFHVITPLRLEDGSLVLVNRGWVPQDWTFESETARPGGNVTVTGLLRKPESNSFTPPNVPEKNQWYVPEPAQIAAAKNLGTIAPYILYRESKDLSGEYPIAQATKPQFPNNHLQYAFFWFSMAGVMLVVYIFRFLKK